VPSPEPAAPALLPLDRCPSCGAAERSPVLRAHGGIALVRCDACGLVHATAGYAPRFLDDHYADRARRGAPATTVASAPRPGSERKRHALALYDRLTGGRLCPAPPGALALDVGCGPGLLLDLLRAEGYATMGIERSGAAAEAIAAGHRVLAIDLEGGVDLPERFTLITLTHVLEHLRRPEQALRWIGAHLRDDGVAIVEVPNWDDLARPLWGPRYRPLELGDHLSFFQRDTLTDLVERAGLVVDALWSAPQARTLLFPSLLTGLDLSLGALRRLRSRGAAASDDRVGVASTRVVAGKGRWRYAAVTGALAGLDRLDPVLERVGGRVWEHGANLVAVLRPRPGSAAAA
jgi:SAM-dependent methyltransferase